jgi:hypothetical protein
LRTVLRALPALGLGILLALALDLVIRRFLPPTATENRHWYLQTVQYHPVLGWSGYPGFVSTKDGIPIQTNSLGYRDREPAEVGIEQRLGVLVLGDSFTWGDEVRLEERFTSLLESSCGLLCDRLPAIRAINNAIIGYGTTQSSWITSWRATGVRLKSSSWRCTRETTSPTTPAQRVPAVPGRV